MGQATPRNRRTAGNSDEILSGRIRCPLPGVTPFFACRKHLSVKLRKTTISNDAANLASHTPQSVHYRSPIWHEKPKLGCLMFTFGHGP